MLKRFFPDFYFDGVDKISYELLKENNIYGIILDIDDTTVGFRSKTPSEKALDWIRAMSENNIKICVVSNNNEKRVKILLRYFDFPSIHSAFKPFKRSFKIAAEKLGLEPKNIAVVGDQVFTDVWGANASSMTSILVNPIEYRPGIFFKIKRVFEDFIIKRYLKEKRGAGQ